MKRYMVAGIAIIAIANMALLAGVFYNRSGEPHYQLLLTEREISVPFYRTGSSENNALALKLQWNTADITGAYRWRRTLPLSRKHYTELGFTVPVNSNTQSKQVYVVLEYNGNAYRQELARLQHSFESQIPLDKDNDDSKPVTEKELQDFKQKQSRLYIVDVGLDYKALQTQYDDRDAYAIVKALIHPWWSNRVGDRYWRVNVKRLSVGQITVPLDKREIFDLLETDRLDSNQKVPPRYQVLVNWGKRLEPWVANVDVIDVLPQTLP